MRNSVDYKERLHGKMPRGKHKIMDYGSQGNDIYFLIFSLCSSYQIIKDKIEAYEQVA